MMCVSEDGDVCDEFIRKCNEFKDELKEMCEEDRDKVVMEILEWIRDAYLEIAEAYASGGVVKAAKVGSKYRKVISENKHKIVVAMVYATKEKFQKVVAPIYVNMFSMFG